MAQDKKEKKAKEPKLVGRTLHHFWAEARKHKVAVFVSIALVPVIIFLQTFLVAWFVAQIIDIVAAGEAANEVATLGGYVAAAIGLSIVSQLVLRRVQIYVMWKFELRVIYELSRKTFDTLCQQSMQFHNDKFGGSLVSQSSKFVRAFEELFDTFIWSFLPMVSTIVFAAVMLFPVVPLYTAGLLLCCVLFLIAALIAGKFSRPVRDAEIEAETKLSGQLADSVSNILTVKSYGREVFENRRFAESNRTVFRTGIKHMHVSTIRDAVFSLIFISIEALLIVFLAFGHQWFGVSVGTLLLIYTYSRSVSGDLWEITYLIKSLTTAFSNAHEMTAVLDQSPTVTDLPGARELKVKNGAVEFGEITFKHADSKAAIFNEFSLKIAPGERIGLVGVSGSGKTTLTKLLLRFADVDVGKITVDNQDIKYVTQESLRQHIAYVPQEATLFHRSIRENIAYGQLDASDAEIIQAAKFANAWEFIQDLPDGLDTLVGERGVKLSGGQRQRVVIARAILKNSPILVLDEATSSLDSESEKLIQDALVKLMQNRTSIVVAHRLSTVAKLDRIIVMKDGKIIESGTHTELLKKGGEYGKLWAKQTEV